MPAPERCLPNTTLEDLERDLGTIIHGSLGVSRAEQKGATGAE